MGETIPFAKRGPSRARTDEAAVSAALAEVARRAAAADAGSEDLGPSLAALRQAGVFDILAAYADPVPGDRVVGEIVTLLRRIGRANLSVGRLVEGHLNAHRLVALYATPAQRASVEAALADGALLGVWGADGDPPLSIENQGDSIALSGTKRFASGLGLVSPAVVSVRTPDGAQLLLVPTSSAERMNCASWTTSGMKATLSGTFDFDGMAVGTDARLGRPGDYVREPHFEGGVWRYATLHVGGMEALAEAARWHAVEGGFADDPLTAARLADLAIACETGRLWVEAAATRVEAAGAGEDVAYVLLAREAVERACLSAIETVDRLIGAASFFAGHPAERVRRDLSFFLRQANLDGKRAKAARSVAASDTPLGEMW
jgi:alkylation response protein AidB-like acyl-CoA dehydrogenase